LPIPLDPRVRLLRCNIEERHRKFFLDQRTQKLFCAELREAGAGVFKILFFPKKQN
jgi:hypothetical protein